MTPDQFLNLLTTNPFVPLKLHLTSGDVVDITDPDCVLIQGSTIQVFTVKKGKPHQMIDTNRYIPLRSIAQIDQSAAA